MRFLHGGTHILLGEDGRAVIINVKTFEIVQTLWMSDRPRASLFRTLSETLTARAEEITYGPEILVVAVRPSALNKHSSTNQSFCIRIITIMTRVHT